MPKVTLADIKAAADRKYGPFVVELPDGEVQLQSLLRLPSKKRKDLLAKADELKNMAEMMKDQPDLDLAEVLEDVLRVVAPSKAAADRLFKACDHDAAVLMEVFLGYMEAAQPGEAQPSES
ncbi:phage tail assembly protein [Nonomuraea aridisoli]|uniref:Tail assembly chaperone n=1 Tax=Nonomuraea aridisoli TaxID=2070368 RepID=A0A2W2FG48_9ACTN|nr:phage tail assembly protein [Nonomuraea aridisoli]PZG20597.1 hypothetical protein C1J01_08825 [Nonomuraea aridisoli]